ncbi:hypothetical protein ACQX0N_14185, partial [Clostridium tepidum]
LTQGFHQTLTSHPKFAIQMTFEEFYRIRFVNWYEKQVKSQTFKNAQFIFEKKMEYVYQMRIRDISSHDVEE